MAIQTQGVDATLTRTRTLGQQPWWILPMALGGLILLAVVAYLLVLLQQIDVKLAAVPQMRQLLTHANDRLDLVSGQLHEMNTNVKQLTPMLGRVNLNVARVSPAIERINANLQDVTPTLHQMDRQFGATDQRLTAMQKKLDALQAPMMQMETTTQRLRKVLPR